MHIPVLLKETIQYLKCKKKGIYVDCTIGCGGHAETILEKIAPGGKLIGIDRDENALRYAKERLGRFKRNLILVKDNFRNIADILKKENIEKVDGVLLDLGFSSLQIEDEKRGFSFQKDGVLDMRMDKNTLISAYDIVNSYSQSQLEKIIFQYGEERYAKRIAKKIVIECKKTPIKTTQQLSMIIKKAIYSNRHKPYKHKYKIHPATRTFMALRIQVNDELEALKDVLPQAIEVLKRGGRLCVLAYHSGEERIIKNHFKKYSQKCVCPKDFPICICKGKKDINVITKKSIRPSIGEIENNPRSRSAKLYVAEKVS